MIAEADTQLFRVLYTVASNKKRKTYLDGKLSISPSLMTLIDDNDKEIYKKKGNHPYSLKPFQSGDEIKIGVYDVQIEGLSVSTISSNDHPSKLAKKSSIEDDRLMKKTVFNQHKPDFTHNSSSSAGKSSSALLGSLLSKQPFRPALSEINANTSINLGVTSSFPKGSGFKQQTIQLTSSATNTSSYLSTSLAVTSSSSSLTGSLLLNKKPFRSSSSALLPTNEVSVESSIAKLMRPHQLVAAKFLISRLSGFKIDPIVATSSASSSTALDDNNYPDENDVELFDSGYLEDDNDDEGDDFESARIPSSSLGRSGTKNDTSSSTLPPTLYTGAILADEVSEVRCDSV